jgi:hypothetical protein
LEERGDSMGATYVANACCSICRGQSDAAFVGQSILKAEGRRRDIVMV